MKCYVWPQRHGWIWSLVLREGLSDERSLSFHLSLFVPLFLSLVLTGDTFMWLQLEAARIQFCGQAKDRHQALHYCFKY